jgi:Ser-tRNA(Ala) deacylase AlaX
VATVPLWVTEPRRATSLSTVTATRGMWFALDRSLYAPTSRVCRHPQPQDQGYVWLQGTKRRLVEVQWRDGELWHRCRDWAPRTGDKLQCHLDADRRLEVSRAHTAMHLLVKALGDAGGALRKDPEVKLGGTVRLDLVAPLAPPLLANVRKRVLGWCRPGRTLATEAVLRSLQGRVLDPQPFLPADPFPGPPDSVMAVRVPDVCAYPCDGTHVDRTDRITDVVFAEAKTTRAGFLLVARVT